MPDSDNDFLDYMGAPISWGGPPSYWQGGGYPSPMTSFSHVGGQHFGNVGSFAGMGMDAMFPQYRGMWDVRSAGGYGNAVRGQQQAAMTQGLMERLQAEQLRIAHAGMQRIFGGSYNNLSEQGQAGAMGIMAMAGGQRYLTPGALSAQGIHQAYSAVSNYGNQWTPTQGSLLGFHTAFQEHFYAGGRENFARTSGLGADDVMAVTAEISRRGILRPAMFSEARRSQDAIIGKLALPGEFAAAGITGASILKDLDAAGGNLGDLRKGLEERLRKSGKTFGRGTNDIVGDYLDKAMGTGADLETQRFAGGMGSASKFASVFKGFQNAGFGGSFGQLMDSLEQQFGDAALSPDRMRAVQQKMAAIVDMTGKSLDQVRDLMNVLQNGPGARLSGDRALTIAGIASGVGAGIQGLTGAQQRAMQMKAGNALASTEKSPRAVMEDILSGSSDASLQLLGKQLRGATGEGGREMVKGLMTNPGQFGLSGATADAFKAMAIGDMRAAATMREMQDDRISRDMALYNNELGTAKSEVTAARRAGLEARGVRFKGNMAVGGPSAVDRARRAGADILGSLGADAQASLRAAGMEFGAGLSEAQQLELGAALGSLSNLGSQKPALPALQEAYKRITGSDLSMEDASRMGEAGVGRLAPLGASINARYYQGAVDRASALGAYDSVKAQALEERSRRTGALNTLGDVMSSKDTWSMIFGQEKVFGAALAKLGITDQTMVSGLSRINELQGTAREAVQLDIAAFNRLTADLDSETDPGARGKLEKSIEEKRKSLASKGIDDAFLDKMSGSEGADLLGRMRDASNVNGQERQITVKVEGVLKTAWGDVQLTKAAEQPNATTPENGARPTK